MFLQNRVPPEARDAYNKDAWAGILTGVMMGLSFPFFAVIARKNLGASDIEIAILTMAPVLGNLFCLFWAKVMEGRRKMPFAIVSWMSARILLILLFFPLNSLIFTTLILLFWVLSSIAVPAYSDVMREVYPDGDRARIIGYVRMWMWCITILVTLGAGQLLDRGIVSYHILFPIAGVFGLVSAWVFSLITTSDALGDVDVSHWQFGKDCIGILRDDRGFRWFCIGTFIFGFANFMATPIYALYEIDLLHAGPARQAIYYFAMCGAMMVSFYFWGSHVDRRRPEKLVAVQELLWVLIPLSYPIIHVWWALMPTKVLWGALSGGVELAYLSAILYFAPSQRITQYQAIFACLTGVRGILAMMLAGALKQSGVLSMQAIFVISGVVLFTSVIVQLVGAMKYAPLKNAGS